MGILLSCVIVWLHYQDFNLELGENLYGGYLTMLHAVLNKYWKQLPTKQQLYGHLPPIWQTIQARRTRNPGYELISDDLS